MKKIIIFGLVILVLIGTTMSVQDELYQEGVLNQYLKLLAGGEGFDVLHTYLSAICGTGIFEIENYGTSFGLESFSYKVFLMCWNE